MHQVDVRVGIHVKSARYYTQLFVAANRGSSRISSKLSVLMSEF